MPDDLQREIFGGSDDDDLSEEEEEQIPRRTARSPLRSPALDSGSEEEGDGDYRDESRPLPSFTKKQRSGEEGGSQRRAPARRPRKKDRAREVEEAPIDEEATMTPDELARHRLHKQIDQAARSGRSSRPKKRKKGDEDELDAAADQEVNEIKAYMERAAMEDQQANREGKPAVAKLKLLQQVTDVLQKQSLMQSIIDANLLENVRIWLEPLSDKSLPGLTIQRALFDAVTKMFIDTSALKESGLGKIIMFYTKKNKRVTPEIKRAADMLLANWSRPIMKRSASYRDRTLTFADTDAQPGRKTIKLSQIMEQARRDEEGQKIRNAVRIPQRSMAAYTIVPRSNIAVNGPGAAQAHLEIERRRAAEQRLRRVQRKVDLNKQRTSRM